MSLRSFAGLVVVAVALQAAVGVAVYAEAELKAAVIDVQKIITESATGKEALAKLEEVRRERENRLTTRRDEIERIRNLIVEGQSSLSEDRLKELQKDFEAKSIELRRQADDARREFSRRQEEALKELERKVMPIIQQYGREQGFSMIFRKFESGLVFAIEEIDITAAVIARLDAVGQGG